MRKLSIALAVAAAALAAPAFAQDMSAPAPTDNSAAPGESAAPDGSKAFGIEPYFGVMGGWEQFDNERGHGIPQALNANGTLRTGYKPSGSLVQGVLGVNVPLGPVFVGAEGNATKGFKGDIDWEYGVAGRFGFRAGDSGLFYGKVGYQWVNFDKFGDNSPDFHAVSYGCCVSGIQGAGAIGIDTAQVSYIKVYAHQPGAGLCTRTSSALEVAVCRPTSNAAELSQELVEFLCH